MRGLVGSLTVAALLSVGVVAQSPAPPAPPSAPAGPPPVFDAAEIHVRPHSSEPNPSVSGGALRAGRFDIRNATMLDLISFAYSVDQDTVLAGPNWLARTRFDIIAKAPDGTPRENLQAMLQSLLADRFKLVLQKDTKPIPSYLLTVSGTPKLKSVPAPTGDDAKKFPCPPQQPAPTTSTNLPFISMSCRGVTMETFGEVLQGNGGYINTRVVDQTGLKGNWDFDLKYSAINMVSRAGSEAITLPTALEQLGLKVTLGTAPAPVLVVQSVNEAPTANPSGAAANLPAPPPAEFDVADIKVAPPDMQTTGRLQPNGRFDYQGVTMKTLFSLAWQINDDALLAGAPSWFDTTKYSIVAKISSSGNDANGVQFDIDDLRGMVRTLVTQRFNLKTHVEDRQIDAYTLIVADKTKLQPANPANRTRWYNGPAPGAKDLRLLNPALNRLVTIENMTMAQFAEDLSAMATGYLSEPVIDATGLPGSFDFVLNFSGINVLNAGRGGGDAGGALGASAPTGALSLQDAIEKELGLKLESHKRPFPVLVIDHIDEHPTDN